MVITDLKELNMRLANFKKNSIAVMVTASLSTMAFAQANAAQEDQTDSDQLIEEQGIDRITVSARKKVESVQDIGVALTSLNGDDIINLGLNKTEDLVRVVPSLDIKQANGQGNVNITLRGVGLNDYSSTTSPTVGVYVDEIFLPYTGMLSFGMFDIERVEVLKGPQGTLYGRNTTGGAITFASARPLNDTTGYAELTYGNYDTIEGRGAINFAITDDLSFRFAAIHRNQGESFYTNYIAPDGYFGAFGTEGLNPATDEQRNFGSSKMTAWRASTLYEGDGVEILANIHGGTSSYPVVPIEHFGGFSADDLTTPCYTGSQPLSNSNGCFDFIGHADPEETGNYGGYYQIFPKNEIDTLGGAIKVDIELGDSTLTSVTGFEQFERDSIDDVSANPVPEYLEIETTDEIDVFSQEIRLTGSVNSIDYIVGAFYSKDDISGVYRADAELLVGGLFAEAFGDPSLADAAFDLAHTVDQETTTYALFSNFDYAISDDLSAVFGLRYTSEEKDFQAATLATPQNDFAVGVTEAVMGPGEPGILLSDSGLNYGVNGEVVATPDNNNYDVTDVSGSIGLEWKVEDDVLLYGTLSKGFKSGGWFGYFAFDFPELGRYDEETLTAYEFGVKSRVLDGDLQFNASAFYYDYSDFQALVETTLGFKLDNVDSASLSGLESEIWYTGIDDLTLRWAVGLLNSDINDPSGRYDGNEMANAPDLTTNFFATYNIDLENGALLALHFDAKYSGEMWKSADNSPYAFSDSFTLLNTRVSYTTADTDWEFAAYIKNITDESYITQGFEQAGDFGANQAYFNEPRTFGVTARYEF